MGNRHTLVPLLIIASLVSAALIVIPHAAHASRGDSPRGIHEQLLKRLCDRQKALGSRLGWAIIHPSFCNEPEPAPEPTVEITADPMTITEGNSSTLEWDSEHADSCEASGGWSGSKNTDGSQSVSPTDTTTYTITCEGDGGEASDSVTVTVEDAEPETATITLVKTVTNDDGGTADADDFQARIDGEDVDWGVAHEVAAGAHTVSEVESSGYTASDWGGDCDADGLLTVVAGESYECTITNDDNEPDAPTVDLVASRTTVFEGSNSSATTTLSWTSTNATSCTASGGTFTGSKATSGSEVVTPTATTTYSIECTGPGGTDSDSVNVSFVPEEQEDAPTVNLVASPTTVHEGSAGNATTTLTWTTTNATSCTASGGTFTGSKDPNDSEVITPTATTTYMIECTGPGGTADDSVTVNFVPQEPAEEGTLVISEVLYDPSAAQGSENGNEWVEIFNGTNGTLNLSGYFLRDNSASEIFVFPQGTTLASGASLLVTGASSTNPTSGHWSVPGNASWLTFSGFSNQLANSGDFVELFNTASSSVDAVCWGPEDNAFNCDELLVNNQGESIGRIDRMIDTGTAADWQIQTPNPGQ